MGEIDNLLNAGIKEFADKRENATAIPCLYLPGEDGMAYLVKDLTKKIEISAAVHLSAEVKQSEDGIYDTGYVSVDTQDDIFSQFAEQPQVVIIDLVHIGDQYKIGYASRFHAFSAGQTIIGGTSGATATIHEVSVNEADNTLGILYLGEVTGSFQDHEDLLVGTIRYAVANVYDGFVLGISKSGDFNEVANTWHYTGELLLTRNSQFLILDEPTVTTKILTDSTTLWLGLDTELGVPILPSFISAKNMKNSYISVLIKDSNSLGPVILGNDNVLQQYKKDSVRLFLVNADANQAQIIAQKIWNAPLKVATFGINGPFPGWQMITDRIQPSFGFKQNVRTMDIDINYTLYSDTADVLKYITKIAATVNGSVIKTY